MYREGDQNCSQCEEQVHGSMGSTGMGGGASQVHAPKQAGGAMQGCQRLSSLLFLVQRLQCRSHHACID